MIAVSVIIPVYNSEKYLADCINSLIRQTLIDCEFIFVNDGSTDKSQEIIENYQLTEPRTQLINQQNKGVSSARNIGIGLASGKYISFVDADDYIENDFLEVLYTIAVDNEVEIVTSNFVAELNGVFTKTKSPFQDNKKFLNKEIRQEVIPFFVQQDLMNTVCNKLYKSDLIKNNSIQFPVGITDGEDGLFNIQGFYKAKSVIFSDYCGYYYRHVENSATRNNKKDYFAIALQKFELDYKKEFDIDINSNATIVNKLKSIRLTNSVLALLHIYLKSNLDFVKNYKYVKAMITNEKVQISIKNYWKELNEDKSKYEQFLLYGIKLKSIILVILAIKYSNYKNR